MRHAPLDLAPAEFRELGHRLVDRLADFLASLPGRPVVPADADPDGYRRRLGQGALPEHGCDARQLLDETADLLFDHSAFNGHPRFMAYITSSAAPVGALGDLLASAVNANCGSWSLSPIASLVEEQTVHWIAQLVGYPTPCGGLLVSGGNMANMVGFWAARAARGESGIRARGLAGEPRLVAYASTETHTWLQKAADLAGLGTDYVRSIPVDGRQRMCVETLATRIDEDRAAGLHPFMVVGTAGTVSTGAVDPLAAIAAVCRERGLWFHVDGAYGAPAAIVADAPDDLRALKEADSVAVDPHKWLYAPLEAGCTLVRRPETLAAAFSYHPAYYHFDRDGESSAPNYYELGPQNSRGFRALKVWLALRQVGRAGYVRMIGDDIRLGRELFELLSQHPELEAVTQGLSITTFRYVPPGVDRQDRTNTDLLNSINTAVLDRLQRSGRAMLSNAVVEGRFLLRGCIVNFRTTREDLVALRDVVVEIGRDVAAGQTEAR